MSGIQDTYIILRQLVHQALQVPVYSESTYEDSNVELPCVVFTRDGTLGTHTMSGPSVRIETVTFDAKATTAEQAEDMRDFIISVLNGYNNGEIQMVLNSEIDDFDSSTGIYSRAISFDVMYGADIVYYNAVVGSGVSGSLAIWTDKYVLSSSNIAPSASYAITASFALNGGGGGTSLVSGAFYDISASYAITSSASTLNTTIVSNQTVGGVSSGTTLSPGSTLEQILRQIFIAYIPPTLSGLVMRLNASNISTSDRDVNNSFQVNTASFTAGADSPNGIGPISCSWSSTGADVGTLSYSFGDAALPAGSNALGVGSTYTINRASAAGTVTFTVNGKRSDTGASITGTSTSVSFRFRNYMAASSTDITSNATAQSVIDNDVVTSTLDTNKAWTATCTSANDTVGNYTYIIYPASYGDLSGIIQNGALPVLTAFTKLGDYTINNAYAASISVRVYKSNSTKAFANGTTLDIS